MKKLLLHLALCVSLTACNNNENSDVETIFEEELVTPVAAKEKELIEIHDRVMEKLPKLGEYSRKLLTAGEGRRDSIEYFSHSSEVDLAREHMMDWMRNYRNPESMEVPVEEKLRYLEREKQKMQEIEEFTNKVLEKAGQLMAEVGDTVQ